ncbi:MAG: 4Fe-4S binding protein [Planctomycetes bacterium]|nr:4Fe-4S binding protein [Planctomycetota bacterium]
MDEQVNNFFQTKVKMRLARGKKRTAMVDPNMCSPEKCDPDEGICIAAKACSHNIIMQDPFDQPMIFQDMCQACGDCAEACPLDAIKVRYAGRAM